LDQLNYKNNETILDIYGLGKSYKNFTLKNIGFSLPRGYVMGFIGPNGAGKTTTIKLIMNLQLKDCGEIRVFGYDHQKKEKEIKNRIGFVYDENHYYGVLSINEMKRIVAPIYSNWDEKLFQRYLKEFNLNPKQKIDDLSKGMKTKFSLAMALSHNAELIIMDEPTSGLDPVFRSELLDILYFLMQDESKSILFSTHITSDLEKIADFITFINDGEIIFSEEKDTVMEQYALVKGPLEVLDYSLEKEFVGLRKTPVGFEGLYRNHKRLKEFVLQRVHVERPTLDDIMIYSVKQGEKGGF